MDQLDLKWINGMDRIDLEWIIWIYLEELDC